MSIRCPLCPTNATSTATTAVVVASTCSTSTAATSTAVSSPVSNAANTAACPLADDWANDERMAFLTSRIAPGDVNARDQMIRFWSKATRHAFEQAPSLSLDLGMLSRSSLAWAGATAPGLELAIADMLSSGELVQRSKLEEGTGLARSLIMAPLMYLFGMMSVGGTGGNIPEGQHMHRDVLESLAEGVVAYCQYLPEGERTVYLHADSLIKANSAAKQPNEQQQQQQQQQPGDASPWCWELLCRNAATASPLGSAAFRLLQSLARDDLALLATYMVQTKRAVREEGVLKVIAGSGGGGGGGRVVGGGGEAARISETDRDLLRLRSSIASLQSCALNLGQRIERSRLEALRENRQGQKMAALVHMRRMKQFQAARDSRMSSLYTLETSLDQVKQLRMDKEVLAAHQAATSALKACREAQGLTVDLVENTLDAFAEEMAAQQAIGAAIAQDDTLLQDTDEKAELEAELYELLGAEAASSATDSTPTAAAVAIGSPAGIGSPGGVASTNSKPAVTSRISADGLSVDGGVSTGEQRIAVPL